MLAWVRAAVTLHLLFPLVKEHFQNMPGSGMFTQKNKNIAQAPAHAIALLQISRAAHSLFFGGQANLQHLGGTNHSPVLARYRLPSKDPYLSSPTAPAQKLAQRSLVATLRSTSASMPLRAGACSGAYARQPRPCSRAPRRADPSGGRQANKTGGSTLPAHDLKITTSAVNPDG